MLIYKAVQTIQEIQQVSKIAHTVFPIDYGPYVRKAHIQSFLEETQSEKAIQKQLDNGFLYFLVYKKNELMGYFGFLMENEKVELSKLYLYQNKRGVGLGANVMEWFESFVKEKGAKKIELFVLLDNVKAIRFYKKLNYEIIELCPRTFDTGYSENNYRMLKNL